MHVSSTNVIRFPETAPVAIRTNAVALREQPPAGDVVPFAVPEEQESVSTAAQAHGSLFAADRIVTRVADELDRIPDL